MFDEKIAAQIYFAFITDIIALLCCIGLNKDILFSFLVGSKGKKEAKRIKASATKSELLFNSYIEPHIEQQKRVFLKYKNFLTVLFIIIGLSVAIFLVEVVLMICDCWSYIKLLLRIQLFIIATSIVVMFFFRTKFSSLHVSKYERRLNKKERKREENK